jgi:deazaflavin-dependent oxidoreductase (nitroreductase family)
VPLPLRSLEFSNVVQAMKGAGFMDDAVRSALEIGPGSTREDRLVDITTYGARTGEPRRIEIVFHRLDGRWYLTGLPGPRGWYANLRKNPRLVFHLKHGVVADVPATARPITEDGERRQVLTPVVADIKAARGGEFDLDDWLARSPLVELTFDDLAYSGESSGY